MAEMWFAAILVVAAAMLGAALPNYGNPFPASTTTPTTYPAVSSSDTSDTWTGTGTASFQPVSPPAPTYSPISSYSCDHSNCENGTS